MHVLGYQKSQVFNKKDIIYNNNTNSNNVITSRLSVLPSVHRPPGTVTVDYVLHVMFLGRQLREDSLRVDSYATANAH